MMILEVGAKADTNEDWGIDRDECDGLTDEWEM